MRRLWGLSMLCLCLGLTNAAATRASVGSGPFTIGVTEDAPKGYDDGGLAMFKTMLGYDLTVDRMAVTWNPSAPTTIQEQTSLQRAINAATTAGVQVVLSIQPAHSTDVTGSNAYDAFAAYCVLVAKAFPQVQDIIIGNEPNLQLFNNPSWNGTQPIGAFNYEHMLASSYDALKAFNPNLDVVGLATSPRGNTPNATSNVGIPPVIFIYGMGQAYKASARSTPIADNVSMHPYPNPNSADDPPSKGYQWPNAGVANLDRLEQAWYDAFNGTGQPVFQEDGSHSLAHAGAPKTFVRWLLDEFGYQVPTPQPGYFNVENWKTVSEQTQAQYYAQVASQLACDPERVASLLYFHWIDEADRANGFQSGFARLDNSIRDAAASVKAAFAAGCQGAQTTWKHITTVWNGSANFASKGAFAFFVRAEEDVTYTAQINQVAGSGTTGGNGKGKGKGKKFLASAPVATATGSSPAYYTTGVKFNVPGGKLPKGTYTYSVTLNSVYGAPRSQTFTSKPFTR